MKLSLVSSLILLLSASLFVNASPIYRRNKKCSVIGDTSMITPVKDIPSDLRPPEGKKFKFFLYATGIQTYKCDVATKSWPLVGPKAKLFKLERGKPKKLVGKHFFQPPELAVDGGRATWQSTLPCDNSYIIEKGLTTHPVGSKDIPWLLVETTKSFGDGAFADVTNVIRIHTKKGIPPPIEDCGTKYKDQEMFNSEYTAEYWFYH